MANQTDEYTTYIVSTFAGLNHSYPAIISNLKSYIETGKPLQAIQA